MNLVSRAPSSHFLPFRPRGGINLARAQGGTAFPRAARLVKNGARRRRQFEAARQRQIGPGSSAAPEPNRASDVSFADLESGPLDLGADAESPAAERRTRSRAEPSRAPPSALRSSAHSEDSGSGPPRGFGSGATAAQPSTVTRAPSVEARARPVIDIEEIEDVTMPTPPRSAGARPADAARAAPRAAESRARAAERQRAAAGPQQRRAWLGARGRAGCARQRHRHAAPPVGTARASSTGARRSRARKLKAWSCRPPLVRCPRRIAPPTSDLVVCDCAEDFCGPTEKPRRAPGATD